MQIRKSIKGGLGAKRYQNNCESRLVVVVKGVIPCDPGRISCGISGSGTSSHAALNLCFFPFWHGTSNDLSSSQHSVFLLELVLASNNYFSQVEVELLFIFDYQLTCPVDDDGAATAAVVAVAIVTAAIVTTTVVTAAVVTAAIATATLVTATVVTATLVTAAVETATLVTAAVVTGAVVTTTVVTAVIVSAAVVTATIVGN